MMSRSHPADGLLKSFLHSRWFLILLIGIVASGMSVAGFCLMFISTMGPSLGQWDFQLRMGMLILGALLILFTLLKAGWSIWKIATNRGE